MSKDAAASDGGPPEVRVLVVIAEPDERASTSELRTQVEALQARAGVRCEVWFLRDYHARRWPGSRNVDALRTWWPSWLLTGIGLGRVAGLLRGWRLRSWQRALAPDVVVLDDGLGERVLDGVRRRPAVVVRQNATVGDTYGFDEPRRSTGDVTVTSTADLADDPSWMVEPACLPLEDRAIELAPVVADAARASGPVRESLGLGGRSPLVVGWGVDGWVDGATAFVRALWFLEHRHGIAAHGAWFGPTADQGEVDRIRAEAVLCGLADRVVLLPAGERQEHWCGDVVMLPWRVPPGVDEVLLAMACRVQIVAFDPLPLQVPWCTGVPILDVPALAAATAGVLDGTAAVPADGWRLGTSRAEHLDQVLSAALGGAR